MASVTLQVGSVYPAGTSVSAYNSSDWNPTVAPSGSPPGSAVTSGTVQADGTLPLSGLTIGSVYYAYAAAGNPKYLRFQVPASSQQGVELGYAAITSNFTQVATSNTVYPVTGLSTTVTTGARPILVQAFIPALTHSVAASEVSIQVYEDGTLIVAATATASSASKGVILDAFVRRNPSVGSHTYDARIKSPTAGTLTALADALYPAFVTVVER